MASLGSGPLIHFGSRHRIVSLGGCSFPTKRRPHDLTRIETYRAHNRILSVRQGVFVVVAQGKWAVYGNAVGKEGSILNEWFEGGGYPSTQFAAR